MATHSRILAWRIPWTEKPHRLQSWTGLRDTLKLRINFLYNVALNSNDLGIVLTLGDSGICLRSRTKERES